MKNLFTKKNLLVASATLAFVFCGVIDLQAQVIDPFRKPAYEQKKKPAPKRVPKSGAKGVAKKKSVGPQIVKAPPIQSRIEYYKRLREQAALAGRPIPKVTSVLLLEEMSVMGIIKTPRGYAAMVEATPIKLSYTIRPGEKFFDGQLVAVEENRLIFRRVTKWDNGKFVATVENKPLRKYSMQQDLQGTTPENAKYEKREQQAEKKGEEAPKVLVSPLDEMNSQPAEKKTETAKKSKKKSSKKKRK